MSALVINIQLEREPNERRKAVRQQLRLDAPLSSAWEATQTAVVTDLSESGAHLHMEDRLPVGAFLLLELPLAGATRARVVRADDAGVACQFVEPLSKAVISAAKLANPISPPVKQSRAEDIRTVQQKPAWPSDLTSQELSSDKISVLDFWNEASCGERVLLEGLEAEDYRRQAEERYRLEPFISEFAQFAETAGKQVLEIGVGLGADHQKFAEAGAELHGIDLTPRAIEHTQRRLNLFGLTSKLQVADAEHLPFADDSFDVVYSWGVIHHSPDTAAAAREILRVLKPGGRFAVMIYHRNSLVGYMLWLRYALLRGRPWLSLEDIYASYLESPGTKALEPQAAKELFASADVVDARVVLSHGDLLEGAAGQRHQGVCLTIARAIWPRRLIRQFMSEQGLYLLVEGSKSG